MARFDLRLSDAEFLRETPYSLGLLTDRAKMADFKQTRGTALVASILANVHRDTKKHPEGFTELDFIPANLVPHYLRQRKQSYSQLSPEKQRAMLASFFGCSVKNGKIVPRKAKVKKK